MTRSHPTGYRSNLEHVALRSKAPQSLLPKGRTKPLLAGSEWEGICAVPELRSRWLDRGVRSTANYRKAESCNRSEHCSLRILCSVGLKAMNILTLFVLLPQLHAAKSVKVRSWLEKNRTSWAKQQRQNKWALLRMTRAKRIPRRVLLPASLISTGVSDRFCGRLSAALVNGKPMCSFLQRRQRPHASRSSSMATWYLPCLSEYFSQWNSISFNARTIILALEFPNLGNFGDVKVFTLIQTIPNSAKADIEPCFPCLLGGAFCPCLDSKILEKNCVTCHFLILCHVQSAWPDSLRSACPKLPKEP